MILESDIRRVFEQLSNDSKRRSLGVVHDCGAVDRGDAFTPSLRFWERGVSKFSDGQRKCTRAIDGDPPAGGTDQKISVP